ncbi:MAG: hypothetical protein K5871_00115 [Lachnospiraceae bacterium]|nr:hypothetical protein [Lachnospiraceae bacterium]
MDETFFVEGMDYIDLSSDAACVSTDEFDSISDKFTGIELCPGHPGVITDYFGVFPNFTFYPVEENQQLPVGLKLSDSGVKYNIDDFKDIFQGILRRHDNRWYFGLTEDRSELLSVLKGKHDDLLYVPFILEELPEIKHTLCMINDSVFVRISGLFPGFYGRCKCADEDKRRFLFAGTRDELGTALNGLEWGELLCLLYVLAGEPGFDADCIYFVCHFLMLYDRKELGDFIRDAVRNTIDFHTICLGGCDVRFPVDATMGGEASSAVFKLSDSSYGLFFEEHLVGKFTDLGTAVLLRTGVHWTKPCCFKNDDALEYYHCFCDWFAGLMVSDDKVLRKRFAKFLGYFLSLPRKAFDNVEWTDPDFLASLYKGTGTGIAALYEWAENEDVIGRLNSLDEDTEEFIRGRGWEAVGFFNPAKCKYTYEFNPTGWLYAEISYQHIKDIISACGGESDPWGYRFVSGLPFIKPCVWDMRSLRESYPEKITSDWYMSAHSNKHQCTLQWIDFGKLLASRNGFKPDDLVNVSHLDVLVECWDGKSLSSGTIREITEQYLNTICKWLGVKNFCYTDFIDAKSKESITFEKGLDGNGLIILPTGISLYFAVLKNGDFWSDITGGEDNKPDSIDEGLSRVEQLLPFVFPPRNIYEIHEPDIRVNRVYRDETGNLYADTSIGVMNVRNCAAGEKYSMLVKDFGSCTEEDWKSIDATLAEIIKGEVPLPV